MNFNFELEGLENVSSFKPTEDRLFALESVESELLGFDSDIQVSEESSGFEGVYYDVSMMIGGMEALFRKKKKEERPKPQSQQEKKEKEGFFKRIWNAIKALFKKLVGYGKSVWRWFKTKLTNGFRSAKAKLMTIICKVSWLKKLVDWVTEKWKGKPLKEVNDDEVAQHYENIQKGDMKKSIDIIHDKKIANWGTGPESVEYTVGTEGVIDFFKSMWTAIKNWVIRVFTGRKAEVLNKDPEAKVEELKVDIYNYVKVPALAVNLTQSAKLYHEAKKKLGQVSSIDTYNPGEARGGVWMLHYAVLLGYSIMLVRNTHVNLEGGSLTKDQFTYEEVQKVIDTLQDKFITNFTLEVDVFQMPSEEDMKKPEDERHINIVELYAAKGYDKLIEYFNTIEAEAEYHEKIFNTNFSMYEKLVDKDPELMLAYFAHDYPDQQKRQMLLMQVIRLNKSLIEKFVKVSKEAIEKVKKFKEGWEKIQENLIVAKLQNEVKEQFGED